METPLPFLWGHDFAVWCNEETENYNEPKGGKLPVRPGPSLWFSDSLKSQAGLTDRVTILLASED